MRIIWVVAFTLFAGSAVLPAREPAAASNPISSFFSRSEQPLRQYRALRRMHATSDNGKHEAWLEAWTELKDGRFSYQIVSERGSDMARGKVLRPMLAREQELVNNGDGRQVGADLRQLRIHRGRPRRRRRARRAASSRGARIRCSSKDGPC